jgi:long-chain fatty acid transport protein
VRRALHALALAVLLCSSGDARAALVGTIFSGPTTGDAAAIYQNPAAMTLLSGTSGLLFGAVSAIRLHYQRDTVSAFDGQPFAQADVFIPKPNLTVGVVTDATLRRFRFGLGVSLPIIDGATWETQYGGRPSSTRYFAMNARLIYFNIEPTVAYRISRHISVGLGLDIVGAILSQDVMTDFGARVNQMACKALKATSCTLDAPLGREDPTYDARTSIGGMGWSAGAFVGVLVTPVPRLRLGASFHTGGFTISIPVDLSVEIPPAVTDYIAKALPAVKLPPLAATGYVETVSPMFATVGIAVDVTPKLELSADMHWTDYSATSLMVGVVTESDALNLIQRQVLIKARDDQYLVGLRGVYQILRPLKAALRFEYENNTRPSAHTTPVSIDFHKFSLHLGASWQITRHIAASLEYGHYFMISRTIESSRFAPNALPTTPEEEGYDKPSPTGDYWVEADRVGVGLKVDF